ncbi:class I SAM-dependent methyltransferase [bacterium]|nr:class I SAM-dependent methyltransferase [bacterium]MDB4545356.1 class I SAM-dependent methyltransferase [bacterium]
MSKFENYTITSENYDLTRQPVGLELIFGALACGSRPLGEQTVLDAGCGTGNYLAALHGKVAKVEGVELNLGMLETAQTKMADCPGMRLQQGSVLELPIEDGACDGVVVNYVLHHLEDGSDASFAATRSAVAEFHRVLAPGGTLIIQTCYHQQYRQGYWYSALIPAAIDRLVHRFIPLQLLEQGMSESGLVPAGRLVSLDEVLQGETYLDPLGPTRQEWRDGDSSWALVEEGEMANVIAEIKRMVADSSMDEFLAEREALRRQHGQATFVIGRKPQS